MFVELFDGSRNLYRRFEKTLDNVGLLPTLDNADLFIKHMKTHQEADILKIRKLEEFFSSLGKEEREVLSHHLFEIDNEAFHFCEIVFFKNPSWQ